jgi:hypothetical protein
MPDNPTVWAPNTPNPEFEAWWAEEGRASFTLPGEDWLLYLKNISQIAYEKGWSHGVMYARGGQT